MSYNLLLPVHVVTAGNMASNITSKVVEIKQQDNIGIQLHWTGAPSGAFDVQISSNHSEDSFGNVINAGNWISLVLDPVIIAAGTPDDAYIDLNQMSAMYVRVIYNRSSGSGTLDGYVVAKGI